MSNVEIANLIAKRYIARADVKAVQHRNGSWAPIRSSWQRDDVVNHVQMESTFGHYMLDKDATCKLFAFDIDLEKYDEKKPERKFYYPPEWNTNMSEDSWEDPIGYDPRPDWSNRKHPARPWMKYKMKMLAHMLARTIETELQIPTLVAYSGSKGLHVYGFTGRMSATDAREGADIVLDALACFEKLRGNHIYKHVDPDVVAGYPDFSIEVYPKQTSLEDKDLGNLMRLPLGRNHKSPKDPCFFVDMTAPMGVLAPTDALEALTTMKPFA